MTSRPSVLLVDDRERELEVLDAVLYGIEADMVPARSGREALALARHREPAVVLLDVQMPGLDGFETARALGEMEGYERLPIIFITAVGEPGAMVAGYELGAVDFLMKPIDPKLVRSKVRVFVELYQQRQKIEQQAREMARSNTALTEFAYVVSHDLQEPLRTVTSFSDLLARRYRDQLDDRACDYMDRTVAAARRMQRLIADLLSYSRVGHSGVELRSVDMGAMSRTVLDDLAGRITAAGANVSVASLPTITADPALMARLLSNLIGNALKFRGAEPPQVRISASREGGAWVFTVADNGIGVAREKAEGVFGVFKRLHTRDAYEGTGIGLSICSKIVELHGGRIWIEPSDGPGATVRFSLPLRGYIPLGHDADEGGEMTASAA